MTVINRQKDALTSNINLNELGKAMSQLDTSDIPLHNRKAAVFDHLMRVMIDTVTDGPAAAKIRQARLGRMIRFQQ